MDVELTSARPTGECLPVFRPWESQKILTQVHLTQSNAARTLTQAARQNTTQTTLLRVAELGDILPDMGETKRGQDAIVRQNLLYVIEACSRRLGRASGGQSYLARLLGSRPQYISSVVNAYENRNLGRDFKAKIEQLFRLDPDWMDREHAESVVGYLVSRVPSLPHQRSTDTPSAPTSSVVRLQNTLDEALKRIAALESELAAKSSTRRKP